MATLRILGISLSLALAAGCPGPTQSADVECASAADCGAVEAPCAGCPPVGDALCRDGRCEKAPALEVDVTGDVNLHRSIASQVAAFVHVLVDGTSAGGPFLCEEAFALGKVAEGVNVLSAGYKAVSGGSFHPDVTLGRAPAGEVGLIVLATTENAGQGDVVATGCVAGLMAEPPALDVGVLDVSP